MSYDVPSLEPEIRAILSAPDVDLRTISAKRVRKQLMEENSALTPDVVKENKEEIDTLISQVFEEVSRAQQDSEDEDDTQTNKRKNHEDAGEEAPVKKKKKSGQEESDAKLARKLSNEINGRATRGAGKSRSNGTAKKGGRAKKSVTTVDSDDDGDEEGGKKKRRGGGGFGKEYNLSEPLSTLLQVEKMSRPQVVKNLWEHIKGNGLQNPNNKREIICDASMKAIFNVDKIDMFQMNKVLGQ
ncbi:Upstream activation factor subunit spp27 [Leucoagaricus sp. SymC.cos]|nr:Upstream activation factor subunit spp27 [Leucoagaricus sp. SymC.cos]